jgi:hypothetical protein
MRHVHVALGHDRYQISVAQLVRDVPSDAEDNDSAVKVTALEQASQIVGRIHIACLAGSTRSCTRTGHCAADRLMQDIDVVYPLEGGLAALGDSPSPALLRAIGNQQAGTKMLEIYFDQIGNELVTQRKLLAQPEPAQATNEQNSTHPQQ